jgi:O-antigen ligase
MTASTAARRVALLSVGCFAAIATFVIGGLFAIKPTLGAAVLGALCYVPLVMISVPLGIAGWISVQFVKTIPGLATSSMLLVIAAAWLGSMIARRPTIGELLPGQRFLVGVLATLLAWLTASLLWAQPSDVGWHTLRLWFVAAGILIVVATTIRTPGQLRLVLGAFVFGGLLSVLIGWFGVGPRELIAVGSLASKSPRRFAGAEGDPNQLAAELIPAIVFAAALAADRRRPVERGALLVGLVILTVGLAATQSRGGLLAVAAVLLASPLVYNRQRRMAMVALALVFTVAGSWFAVSPQARRRVESLNNGGDGRTTLWLVAWRIAEDHPFEGVGLNNFRVVAPQYVFRPGALRYVEQITDKPHVVHSTYLELLAETGIVGLGLFLAAVAACLSAARRAARIFERLGQADMARLSRAVLLAGCGALAAQLFLSNGDDWRSWVLLALGPVLLTLAHQTLARTRAPS